MIYFTIIKENGNIESHILISYEINIQEEQVIVTFTSTNFSVSYRLCPNTRFETVDEVKDYLGKILENSVEKGRTIKITEAISNNSIKISCKAETVVNKAEFAVVQEWESDINLNDFHF